MLSGITNENEIMNYANNIDKNADYYELVPHFYTNSLKDLLELADTR